MTIRLRTILATLLLLASTAATASIADVRFQNTGATQANVPLIAGPLLA